MLEMASLAPQDSSHCRWADSIAIPTMWLDIFNQIWQGSVGARATPFRVRMAKVPRAFAFTRRKQSVGGPSAARRTGPSWAQTQE